MQRGVVYGVMAGALWGMVFLVPRLLPDFSPLLLGAGRYTMYGVVSLVAAMPAARSLLARLSREDLRALVTLALAGNIEPRKVEPRAICQKVRAQGGDPGDRPSANARSWRGP